MKIDSIDDGVCLFLNKLYFDNIDFVDKVVFEKSLKNIIDKISRYYKLNFDGYYNVCVYVDVNYGIIVEIVKDELEYFDYFTGNIEMNVKVIEDSFLYEFDDLFDELFKFDVYKYSDKIYVHIDCDIDYLSLGRFLEFSNIIYGNKKQEYMKKCKKVR